MQLRSGCFVLFCFVFRADVHPGTGASFDTGTSGSHKSPESQHDMRDPDTAKQIVKNLPLDLQAVVDQQLFNTPDTARTTTQVFDVLDRKAAFMRARGQSSSQFPPPAGAPVDVHAQPVPGACRPCRLEARCHRL